jgi:hypothetical protein
MGRRIDGAAISFSIVIGGNASSKCPEQGRRRRFGISAADFIVILAAARARQPA